MPGFTVTAADPHAPHHPTLLGYMECDQFVIQSRAILKVKGKRRSFLLTGPDDKPEATVAVTSLISLHFEPPQGTQQPLRGHVSSGDHSLHI